MFPLGGIQGCRAPNLNLGPSIISESTTARKLNLKILLDIVKYLPWSQKMIPLGGKGVEGTQGSLMYIRSLLISGKLLELER